MEATEQVVYSLWDNSSLFSSMYRHKIYDGDPSLHRSLVASSIYVS